MITEMAIMGTVLYAWNKFNHRGERQVNEQFQNMLIKANVKNTEGETFTLYKPVRTSYGMKSYVYWPDGLNYSKLEHATEVIQDGFGCLMELEKDKFDNHAVMKLITHQVDVKEFEPMKTKANEIYLGTRIDGRTFILDLNKDCHILIAGMTGTGKSFLLASILTNLFYNNCNDIEVYLFQVMKGEIDIFRNCKPVMFVSDNEEQIAVMLQKLCSKIHKRSKMFAEKGIKNIEQWNKHYPQNRMKRMIVGVEEISFFMDSPDDRNNPYFKDFTSMVKAGRTAGIHVIALTQRTTAANLGGSGELKSQMTVVTGAQRNGADSSNAIDIPDAKDLKIQEYIASSNNGYVWFKAPTIDEDYNILHEYVPEIITPEPETKQTNAETRKAGSRQVLSWKIPTVEEWNRIKNSIPDNTFKEEIQVKELEPKLEQEVQQETNSGNLRIRERSGMISLEELRRLEEMDNE